MAFWLGVFVAVQALKRYFINYLETKKSFVYERKVFDKISSVFTSIFGTCFSGSNLANVIFVGSALM